MEYIKNYGEKILIHIYPHYENVYKYLGQKVKSSDEKYKTCYNLSQ